MNTDRKPSSVRCESLEDRKLFSTYTVTTAADSGQGSLRWALEMSNKFDGPDKVKFDITSASKAIKLATDLPELYDQVVIDGTSQPGYSGRPIVTIDGSTEVGNNLGHGLVVRAPACEIRGLSVVGFGKANKVGDGVGILVHDKATSAVIENNYVGLLPDGVTVKGNDGSGVRTLGRYTVVRNNVISGNRSTGVWVNASTARVERNKIGTDASGTLDRGNTENGVFVATGQDTVIGGKDNGNLISGNDQYGVKVADPAYATEVSGNRIGTTADGMKRLKNAWGAALVQYSQNTHFGTKTAGNQIGGSGLVIRGGQNTDVIGNTFGVAADGVGNIGGSTAITVEGSNKNRIEYNRIGHYSTGVRFAQGSFNTMSMNQIGGGWWGQGPTWGNGYGVVVANGSFNEIGSVSGVNTIRGSTYAGIWVQNGVANRLDHNSFNNNGTAEIDLGAFGPEDNDAGDTDEGANDLLNTPMLTSAVADGTTMLVKGSLQTKPGQYYVQFYASPTSYAGNVGKATRYFGGTFQTVGKSGKVDFTITFQEALPAGYKLSALTAVQNSDKPDRGTTSELSQAVTVQQRPRITKITAVTGKSAYIAVQFSQDVGKSLSVSDLLVRNRTIAKTILPQTVQWDGTTKTAYFKFNGKLPAGSYYATLDVNGVTNAKGLTVSGEPTIWFTASAYSY